VAKTGNPVFALREGVKYEKPKRSDIARIDYRNGNYCHWSNFDGSRHQLLDAPLPIAKCHTGYRFNDEDCTNEGDFK
jgi:hypothetical protein